MSKETGARFEGVTCGILLRLVNHSGILEQWQFLMRNLGVEESEITAIKKDYAKDNLKETVYQALLKWRDSKEEATIAELLDALDKCEIRNVDVEVSPLRDDAEDYDIYIASSDSNEDYEKVKEIITHLETMRFRCLDPRVVYPEEEWANVQNCVNRSKHVLILLTKALLEQPGLLQVITVPSRSKDREKCGGYLIVALVDVTEKKVPEKLKDYNKLEVADVNFTAKLCNVLVNRTSKQMFVQPNDSIGRVLAWSYFYDHLRMLLPGLHTRYRSLSVFTEEERLMPLKMFILIPASCYCPPSVTDVNKKFKLYEETIPFSVKRAGCHKRIDNKTVYSVPDDTNNNKIYYVQIEFANPVLLIWEMCEDRIAGLKESERDHQRNVFFDVLRGILNHDHNKDCHDKVVLLYYDDSVNQNNERLPSLVVERIKLEIKRDLMKEKEENTSAEEDVCAEERMKVKPTHLEISESFDLPRYDMDVRTGIRGKAVIISCAHFKDPRVPATRHGVEIDNETMRKLWSDLGFLVEIYEDLAAKDIMRTLANTAMQDHSNHKAFVCCLSSYGYSGGMYGSDGKTVSFIDIAHVFSGSFCESLDNKPKLFFIQCARFWAGTVKERRGRTTNLIPSSPDLVISSANVPCGVAYRHTEKGSFYFNSLDKNIRQYRKYPLSRILRRVSQDVQTTMQQLLKDNMVSEEQIPFDVSTLTKEVYL